MLTESDPSTTPVLHFLGRTYVGYLAVSCWGGMLCHAGGACCVSCWGCMLSHAGGA